MILVRQLSADPARDIVEGRVKLPTVQAGANNKKNIVWRFQFFAPEAGHLPRTQASSRRSEQARTISMSDAMLRRAVLHKADELKKQCQHLI